MDDTTLIAKAPAELEELISHYLIFCRKFRIKLNVTKSKLMRFTRDKSDAGELAMEVQGHKFTTPKAVEAGKEKTETIRACGQTYLGFVCDTHMTGCCM